MTEKLPDNIDGLVQLLAEDVAHENQITALSALGDMILSNGDEFAGAKAVLSIVNLIQTRTDSKIVMHAVSVLGRVKPYSAVMVLVDVALGHEIKLFEDDREFKDSDEGLRLRCAAVQALGKMNDERAITPMMSLLNDRFENYRLRLAAAESLGRLGNPNAVVPLIDVLRDEREKSLYLKESAVKALGMLGDIRAMEALIEEFETRKGVRDKFDFLKERLIESMGRLMGGGADDRKAIDILMNALDDEASSIRLASVEALADVGDGGCIPKLKEKLFDSDDTVALAAVSAIYNIGDVEAMVELRDLDKLPQFLREEIESYIP